MYGFCSRDATNNKNRLFNDVRSQLEEMKIGFHSSNWAQHVMLNGLTNFFWYLDPFHEQLTYRSCKVPQLFEKYQGYRDWRAQKVKKPVVCSHLNCHLSVTVHVSILCTMWNKYILEIAIMPPGRGHTPQSRKQQESYVCRPLLWLIKIVFVSSAVLAYTYTCTYIFFLKHQNISQY
jgi:hypothetical protein